MIKWNFFTNISLNNLYFIVWNNYHLKKEKKINILANMVFNHMIIVTLVFTQTIY